MGDALHEGEAVVDEGTVRALLRAQAPELVDLPVVPLRATGTVNRVFRIGDELAARLPRLPSGGEDVVREARVVPLVADALPVDVPEPVLLGEPVDGVLGTAWSVVRWVDGEQAEAGSIPMRDLAETVLALRTIDPSLLPPAGRPTAAEADATVRDAITRLEGFDRAQVELAWDAAREVPLWNGVPVAIHADLLPPNLLVREGRLAGVLDWGTAGAGDPANDLVPAWSCLRGSDRERFRGRLMPDRWTWVRGWGIALAQAVVAIPYYDRTNPRFAALCRATLTEVLKLA